MVFQNYRFQTSRHASVTTRRKGGHVNSFATHDMKSEHTFTRDGTTYSCTARPSAGAIEGDNAPSALWFVTADGKEIPSISVSDDEFDTPENQRAFEDVVVRDATFAE
jgi:hypothetical protein